MQVLLKFDKNKGYFTRILVYIYSDISLYYSRIKNVSHTICRGKQKAYFAFNNIFSGKRALSEITWKNLVQPERQQTTK